jgi:D-alanyl-D-alanine-carboxypeptidase/D-alanyl-D-alanine-endopeptidase
VRDHETPRPSVAPRPGRRRSRLHQVVWPALLGLAAAGCGADGSAPSDAERPAPTTAVAPAPTTNGAPAPSVTARSFSPAAFAAADAAMDRRTADPGVAGGVAVVVHDGVVVHEHTTGRVNRSSTLAVASTAKWLTAATVLTFVDAGALRLDDPVERWLPGFAPAPGAPPTTVRHLLVHTSGIRDQPCLWNTGDRLAGCVDRLAGTSREFPPGSAFSYGNAGYHVAGRLLEILGGADFATVVHRRIGEPLGLTATTWPGAPGNPSPAAGVRISVDDALRFLALLASGGTVGDRRVLSAASVDELTRDQVTGYDKGGDQAVGITGIPRYALGAWPDEIDATGRTVVVSGNGARGFYPWIDLRTRTWGVVGVQDDRGAAVAVPVSQQVARAYWEAARG